MKYALILAMSLALSSSAFASDLKMELGRKLARKAGAEMVKDDVRTVVREVENTDGNPCMPEGKSFQVDLQVKTAIAFDRDKMETVYEWVTAKTIGVDVDGSVMEICAE